MCACGCVDDDVLACVCACASVIIIACVCRLIVCPKMYHREHRLRPNAVSLKCQLNHTKTTHGERAVLNNQNKKRKHFSPQTSFNYFRKHLVAIVRASRRTFRNRQHTATVPAQKAQNFVCVQLCAHPNNSFRAGRAHAWKHCTIGRLSPSPPSSSWCTPIRDEQSSQLFGE